MTAREVLENVASARFPAEEVSEIREALAEAEAEFERGEGISAEEMRRRFGLQ